MHTKWKTLDGQDDDEEGGLDDDEEGGQDDDEEVGRAPARCGDVRGHRRGRAGALQGIQFLYNITFSTIEQ